MQAQRWRQGGLPGTPRPMEICKISGCQPRRCVGCGGEVTRTRLQLWRTETQTGKQQRQGWQGGRQTPGRGWQCGHGVQDHQVSDMSTVISVGDRGYERKAALQRGRLPVLHVGSPRCSGTLKFRRQGNT